jgi:copper chaperone NosL
MILIRSLVALFIFLLPLTLLAGEALQPELPSGDERCEVCGMKVALYPLWTSIIIFIDGESVYFDGPKDMFRYLKNINKYENKRKEEDISGLYVTEYYTTKIMNAKDVRFIIGSNVNGPMGIELVPVKGESAIASFLGDHRGEKSLAFFEVTAEILEK